MTSFLQRSVFINGNTSVRILFVHTHSQMHAKLTLGGRSSHVSRQRRRSSVVSKREASVVRAKTKRVARNGETRVVLMKGVKEGKSGKAASAAEKLGQRSIED